VQTSVQWFIFQIVVSTAAFGLGLHVGRTTVLRKSLWLGFGLGILVYGTWLQKTPSVAVQMVPLWVLPYIEGTAGVPGFMLVIGVFYAHSKLPQQRRLAALAVLLGVIYFFQGGLWMLQVTPTRTFAHNADGELVRQSRDYSCVAASCATALRQLGVDTSESEMAMLTQTRPGTGSTIVRALHGLQIRLSGMGVVPSMLEPSYEQVMRLEMPILTLLQLELGKQHMVTLLRIDDMGVQVADPQRGMLYLSHDELRASYVGQVITFEQ
tara:strand:+ start:459 stop:1259 length:801 start_codon:yes stop_codon:yes gene_type:complete